MDLSGLFKLLQLKISQKEIWGVTRPNKSNPRLIFFMLVNTVQTCSLRVIFLDKQTWS